VSEFLDRFSFESEIERERALVILERVEASSGQPCPGCGRALLGQEIVESVVLGYQNAPRCHTCLSAAHDESPEKFLLRMREYVDRIACFRATWAWTGERGGEIVTGTTSEGEVE
jgi:ssDNA-binding Zn-finger/Zn-ribbon topoisomerase 1